MLILTRRNRENWKGRAGCEEGGKVKWKSVASKWKKKIKYCRYAMYDTLSIIYCVRAHYPRYIRIGYSEVATKAISFAKSLFLINGISVIHSPPMYIVQIEISARKLLTDTVQRRSSIKRERERARDGEKSFCKRDLIINYTLQYISRWRAKKTNNNAKKTITHRRNSKEEN